MFVLTFVIVLVGNLLCVWLGFKLRRQTTYSECSNCHLTFVPFGQLCVCQEPTDRSEDMDPFFSFGGDKVPSVDEVFGRHPDDGIKPCAFCGSTVECETTCILQGETRESLGLN